MVYNDAKKLVLLACSFHARAVVNIMHRARGTVSL